MESKIKVEDLSFYYGNEKALNHINMDIEKQKITALIGPSRLWEIHLFAYHKQNE